MQKQHQHMKSQDHPATSTQRKKERVNNEQKTLKILVEF